MADRLKDDLQLLSKLFPPTHDRFRILRSSSDELACVFVGSKGETISVTGTITASAVSALWFTESEEQQISETLEGLNNTCGRKNMLLTQVRKLISNLCAMYKLAPPVELKQLISRTDDEKESAESTKSVKTDDSVSGIDESEESNSVTNTATDTKAVLKKVKAELMKKALSGIATPMTANKRLMREFKEIRWSEACKNGDWIVELVDDNIFDWSIKVRKVDDDSALAQDLKTLKEKHGQDFVHFNLRFKDNYPFMFPIVCIVTPRMTDGHVFDSGAICLELLTKEGWSSSYTAEKVILQVISLLCVGKARIRFDNMTMVPYEKCDRENSYARLAAYHKQHGWYTPPDEKG